MTREHHEMLVTWIHEGMIPWNKFNHRFTANCIKTTWEYDRRADKALGEDYYICETEINDALLECGFLVHDERAPYWAFNIAPQSPAYIRFLEYTGHPRRRG